MKVKQRYQHHACLASNAEKNKQFEKAALHWGDAAISAKNMSNQQWAIARERLCLYLAQLQNGEGPQHAQLPNCYDREPSRINIQASHFWSLYHEI